MTALSRLSCPSGPVPDVLSTAMVVPIDGQVRLVRLQIDNNCLFLGQQTDKWKTSICMMSKPVQELRKIAWASVFRSICFRKCQNSPTF